MTTRNCPPANRAIETHRRIDAAPTSYRGLAPMRTRWRAAYRRRVMERNTDLAAGAHHHERRTVAIVAAVVAVATGIAIGRPEALLDGALTLARSILEEPWWLDLAR